ncbi:MAG: flippase-like domain-containing protein [Oscillospiraceae bacterium]|nr:flippase-like domain-containing protein [Oscillospiraceae bacterium]
MAVYILFVDGVDNLLTSIAKMKVGFLLLAVGLMVVYWLMEAWGLHAALKTLHPRQKFRKTLVVTVLGQYYNCITPSASGGQPMQAFYLTQFGTPLSDGMTALLSKFIVYQFVLIVYTGAVLLIRFKAFTGRFAPLMMMVIFGFVINAVVIVLLLMLAFFKAPVKKVAVWGVKLLGKLRLIKADKLDAKTEEISVIIEKYHSNFCFIRTKPLLIFKMILYTFVQLTAYFSVSYIIYLGFGLSETDYFTVLSCQAFVMLVSAVVPLPGAVGAAEGSYSLFFKDIFAGGGHSFVGISVFIWRFLTFYLPIIMGLVISPFLGKMTKKSAPAADNTA